MVKTEWMQGWFDEPTARSGEVNQTERVVALLLILGLAALVIIALYALTLAWFAPLGGFRFLVWAWLTALAAWLAGILLGLLFGLPSVVEVRITDGEADGKDARASPGSLGYRESTNLEQIADWITKILIGLTLTQYAQWQQAFESAFERISVQMFACPASGGCPPVDAAPTAVIAISFAANGFLSAYLLMRRYFITEMVKGKGDAERARKRAEQARKEIEAARDAGLLQDESVTKSAETSKDGAVAMADIAASLSPIRSAGEAESIAREVRNDLEFPDDPWRGKFGETDEAGGCRLSAAVEPLAGSSDLFNVQLKLTAHVPDSRAGQTATFYLHPSFGGEPKKVAFGKDGIANLGLIAYGAFTVGVLLETGERLELNLATLEGAPAPFKLR